MASTSDRGTNIEIVTGAPTTGKDFFAARNKYVETLKAKLQQSDVLVIGPRRTGKTSLISEYLNRLPEEEPRLYLNLEDSTDLYHFYIRFIREVLNLTSKLGLIKEKTSDFIRSSCDFLNKIFPDKFSITFKGDSLGIPLENKMSLSVPKFDPDTLEDLKNYISKILSGINVKLTIVLDEFPELIFKIPENQRPEITKQLMSCLRAIRQKSEVDDTRVHHIIIAGSINLENTLSHLGLSDTINDLSRLDLKNLNFSEAELLLRELGKTEKFEYHDDLNVTNFFDKYFGYCTPFYVQIFADYIAKIKLHKSITKIEIEHFKEAYMQLIKGDRGPVYFMRRLSSQRYYDANEKSIAEEIIARIAENQASNKKHTSEKEIREIEALKSHKPKEISQMIHRLIIDDFFQIHGGNYYFESNLVCYYWDNYFSGKSVFE